MNNHWPDFSLYPLPQGMSASPSVFSAWILHSLPMHPFMFACPLVFPSACLSSCLPFFRPLLFSYLDAFSVSHVPICLSICLRLSACPCVSSCLPISLCFPHSLTLSLPLSVCLPSCWLDLDFLLPFSFSQSLPACLWEPGGHL